jgi:hypothetical protein
MTTFKLRSELTYIGGRLIALASRPLMLLVLNYWAGNEVAATIAVVFLVTMLATAVSAFDNHRGFYQAYFGCEQSTGVRSSYRLYCGATALQVAVVSPLLAIFLLYWFKDPVIALLVAVYFASERIADEAQRFLIFTGRRQEWGWRIMAKAMIQFIGVSVVAALLGPGATQATIGFLLAGNLAAYGNKLPWRYLPVGRRDWRNGIISCLKQRSFWALSLLSSSISYLDRVVVMLFQQSDMAVYTILVSSMSIVQNAVDYFFVSLRRQDILKGHLSLADIFLNRRFYIILVIAAFIACVVSWVMLHLYHGKEIVHFELVLIVLLSQLVLSVTLVLREIIYWNHSVKQLVLIEGCFIMCTLTAASVLRGMGQGYEVVLGMLSIFFSMRMCLMIWGIARVQKYVSIT